MTLDVTLKEPKGSVICNAWCDKMQFCYNIYLDKPVGHHFTVHDMNGSSREIHQVHPLTLSQSTLYQPTFSLPTHVLNAEGKMVAYEEFTGCVAPEPPGRRPARPL